MNEAIDYFELCDVGDVTSDLPFKARMDETDLAVFQVGDLYYVTQDACTHGPGSLCEGYVEGDEIECPFHQGKFSIITGEPTAPPCMEPLKTWKTMVRDGKIFIERSLAGHTAA
jgi:nitrite reductase/ring-hydroxylating ferredoxin subunit